MVSFICVCEGVPTFSLNLERLRELKGLAAAPTNQGMCVGPLVRQGKKTGFDIRHLLFLSAAIIGPLRVSTYYPSTRSTLINFLFRLCLKKRSI